MSRRRPRSPTALLMSCRRGLGAPRHGAHPKSTEGEGVCSTLWGHGPGQPWHGLTSPCRLQRAGAGGSCGRLRGTDSDVQDETKLY